jgi:hypothetical protein
MKVSHACYRLVEVMMVDCLARMGDLGCYQLEEVMMVDCLAKKASLEDFLQ